MKHSYRRKVWLVAWAHFATILKAKAFWIGLFMTPAIGLAMVFVTRFAEKTQPTRYFVVADNTDLYRSAIEDALAKGYAQRALRDYADYFAQYQTTDWSTTKIASPSVEDARRILRQYFGGARNEATEEIKTARDMANLVERSRSLLQTDAPPYSLVKQRYALLETPTDLSSASGTGDIADTARSYTLGKKTARLEGRDRKVDVVVIIDAGVAASATTKIASPRIQYWSTNQGDNTLVTLIENSVNQSLRGQLLAANGIDAGTLSTIERTRAELTQLDARKEKGNESRTLADRVKTAVPIVFAVVMLVILIISTSILLQSIVEEKSSRLIEVLLSSVTSTQLMAGKLLGVAGVSLVSIALWVALALAGVYFGFGLSGAAAQNAGDTIAATSVSPAQIEAAVGAIATAFDLLPVFLFCFTCSYLIYASLFLAIGSLCNSAREANALITPLMLLMMVPFLLIQFFISDPHGPIVTAFTWIPLYTPFAIVVRISTDPPLSQIIGPIFVMLLMTAFMLWLSARVFRFGVLHGGETPKLFQVFRLALAGKQNL